MCRSIKTLHNFVPPATEEEIRAAALQYVRKIAGVTRPSLANAAAFDEAVACCAIARRDGGEAVHRGTRVGAGERRFQVLVLANLCAVIARELRAGPEPSLADVCLFRELLGRPVEPHVPAHEADAAARATAFELAAAVRAGELDDRLDEALGRLREHVSRKLEVARPGYVD